MLRAKHIQSIIFLDVDGPINTDVNKRNEGRLGNSTSSYYIHLPTAKLRNLKMIVDCVPNTKIVLSSKWRYGGSPSPARMNLENQMRNFDMHIYSETPYLGFDRGIEITTWLETFRVRNGYIPPYIILDNEIDPLLSAHRGHVVYCDSRDGLTEKTVNISINLLNRFKVDLLRNL